MISGPQYTKCKIAILDYIVKNGLRQGDILPSQRDMCGCFGTSMITIRRALAELQAAEIVHPTPGKGMFVSKNVVSEKPLGSIILLDINAPFRQIHNGLQYLHKYVRLHGYQFKSFVCGEYPDDSILKETGGATGLLATGVITDAWKDFLGSLSCSVVNMGLKNEHIPGTKTVYSDAGDDVGLAVDYFAAAGYKKIAFLNAPKMYYCTETMHNAFLRSLKKHSLPILENLESFIPDEERSVEVRRFLFHHEGHFDCLLSEAGIVSYILSAFYENDLKKVPLGIVGGMWNQACYQNQWIVEFGRSESIFKLAVDVLLDSFQPKKLQKYPASKIKNESVIGQACPISWKRDKCASPAIINPGRNP
ncbi:MAG: putative transcriptional regulator of 2-aminoethylphosphonate degradation operons [Lentisphaerae bacterium ADurb.Bin242]|nr:MAG: putative transcriptional regulator of 2-aminoethylphosphonate degradation operons [Lentisphaerae bacterium ADurb.Bin242]